MTPASSRSAVAITTPRDRLRLLLDSVKFLWNLRVPDSIIVEINDADAHPVFHFAFAELVQIRLPARILFQIIGDMFGEKNVSSIAAIHHPLGDVDSRPGDVCLLVQVSDFVDRPL